MDRSEYQGVSWWLLAAAMALALAASLLFPTRASGQPIIRGTVITTVGNLPPSPEDGRPYIVTDGATSSDCSTGGGTDIHWCIYDADGGSYSAVTGGGGGGTSVALDLADDDSNESSALTEIAVTGDTNSIFSEPSADKLLVAAANNWPTSDASDSLSSAATVTDYIDFPEIATPSAPGANTLRLWAEAEDGHSVLHWQDDNSVDLEIGRDVVHIVRNVTGAQIDAGDVVYISGATGGFLTVAPAQANSTATMPAVGLMLVNLANNSNGLLLAQGDLKNVDTSAWSEGAELYVSTSVAGGLTDTAPTGANLRQHIATVGVSNPSNGTLVVDTGAEREPVTSLGSTCADAQVLGGTAAGTGVECQTDDDVPESGDFGAAADLESTGALSNDVVAAAEMADADHGDVSWSAGVATVDSGAVGVTELADDATCGANEVVARNAGDTAFECQAASSGGDSVRVEDGDEAGTFTAVDTTADLNDSASLNFVLTDGGAGGPDAVAGSVKAVDYDNDGTLEVESDGSNIYFRPDDASDDIIRFYSADNGNSSINLQYGASKTTGFIYGGGGDYDLYLANVRFIEGTDSAAMVLYGGGSFSPQVRIDGGGISIEPSTATCADSGDGNPGTVTITPTTSHIQITNSDADGCTPTMSESGAVDGQTVKIFIVSNAGGTVDFTDSPGVLELSAAFSMDTTDSLTLDYVAGLSNPAWVESSRSNN